MRSRTVALLVAPSLAAWVVRRHGDRPGRAWPWLAPVLVAPSLLVGLLHATLPPGLPQRRVPQR